MVALAAFLVPGFLIEGFIATAITFGILTLTHMVAKSLVD
jgi:hypothetical protein